MSNAPSRKEAANFLTQFDEEAEFHTFQTFDDNKQRSDKSLARIFHGSLEQHWDSLVDLNQRGAGIFFTVNVTDGNGRKLANIMQPRAVFQEADRPNTPLPPLDPHIEVESSSGKFHRYWLTDSSEPVPFDEWDAVMERMVVEFGSDRNARDRARVLRLPGFFHMKNPLAPHMVRIVKSTPVQPYQWTDITAKIPPLARQATPNRQSILATEGRGFDKPIKLVSALSAIPPDCDYQVWVSVGMALHHASGGSGEGFRLWDEWSAKGNCYRDGETDYKWDSFGRYSATPVMLGTVFYHATQSGWKWEANDHGALEHARTSIQQLIADLPANPKAHLAPAVSEALSIIKAHDMGEYESNRMDIKQANSEVRLGALDDMVAHASETAGIDSLSRRLTEAATGRCELWHDTNGNAYASFDREDANKVSHREHWSIGSRGFREWLAFLAHTELKATPSAEIIKSCASALAGIAKFDGPEYVPGRRVMKTANGYWLDICDDEWRAISITDMGWQVVSRPPVRFMRNGAMRSLPIPVPGGDIAKLYPLVNIPVEDLTLALALLLDWLRPDTPYPVLELIGEQGSAKSTTQKTLRALIDPNKVMLRGRPKTVEDLFVAAGNNHLISLENLSGLSADLSDALCTIATGGGQAGRQYFTNDEEFTIEAHNPVAVNGIGAIITRPDLLDRAVALCLPVINGRMTELEHTQALEAAASDILGGLLDLFVKTLAFLPKVVIAPEQRPRMADFAMLGEAMVQSMGQPEGSFLGLYQHHRRDAIRRTIDSNPVAVACISFLKKHGSFEGTVGNLLGRLNLLGNDIEKGDYWPRTPRGLGDGLRRVAPALRQVGIDVSVDNKAKRDGVHCRLKLLPGDSYLVDGGPAHVLEPSPTSQRSPVGRNTKATTTKHGRKV